MSVQKKPPSKMSRRPLMRPRDRNLIKRAESACGLRELVAKAAVVGEVGVTGNLVLAGAGDTLVPFAMAAFVGLYPEGKIEVALGGGKKVELFGKRLRFVVLHPHFEDGEIYVGGSTQKKSRPDSEDGFHGLYDLPNGRTCWRRDIPSDYEGKETPTGLYKDLRMESGTHPLSIFSHVKQLKESNRRARRLLAAALTAIEAEPTKGAELETPFALVDRAGASLDLRFLRGDISDVMAATELLCDVIRAGLWTLPGLEDVMMAKAAGVVKDIGEHFITVEWDDGDGEMLHTPKDAIAEYIRARVHVKTANLPVEPLVQLGEKFDAGTVLWGGSADAFVDIEDFMSQAPQDVNEQQARQLLRVWAVLVSGTHREGLEAYPLNYVIPHKASQIHFYPCVSRVALTRNPSKLMAADSTGIHVDLFTSSHRDRYWREYREKQEQKQKAQSA